MYQHAKKVLDRNKSIVNRFIVDLYHDEGVKVLLEAPTMMGIRMAMNAGDKSDYHVINVKPLPHMDTDFSLTRHEGTLLDVLEQRVLPKCHVFYADYCGSPLKTNAPIKKDPPLEAKYIYDHLLPRGVGIFTFCQRGCKSARSVAEKLLAPHFKTAFVHTYANMMVFITVKRTASDSVVSEIRHLFQAVLGKYYCRSGHFITPEEKALVLIHKNKDLKYQQVNEPEECEVCLNWFNDQCFFIETVAKTSKVSDVCICHDCWKDVIPSSMYEIQKGVVQWKSSITNSRTSHGVTHIYQKYKTLTKRYETLKNRYETRKNRYGHVLSVVYKKQQVQVNSIQELEMKVDKLQQTANRLQRTNQDLCDIMEKQDQLVMKQLTISKKKRNALINTRRGL